MLILLHSLTNSPLNSTSIGERVNHIENSMGKITTTVNNLVDAHAENLEERRWLKAKTADLKDRSSCKNLKLWRGGGFLNRSNQAIFYSIPKMCLAFSYLKQHPSI